MRAADTHEKFNATTFCLYSPPSTCVRCNDSISLKYSQLPSAQLAASEATATSRQRSPATAFNVRQSAQKSGTRVVAHRTLYSTCPVLHRTSRRAQKTVLQRSNPIGFGDVAGAPDMSGAPYDSQPHQTASLVVGAINTPNHPTFKSSKFSHFNYLQEL